MNRREFIETTVAAGCGLVAGVMPTIGTEPPQLPILLRPDPGRRLTDTNVSLSRWPFRRLPLDEPSVLAARLRRCGVSQAWTGNFDGIFHKDLAAVNARLAADCRRHGRGLFVPFGSINPMLPDWREELRRCRDDYHMPGIRLHPNYHGYSLEDPQFGQLLDAAANHTMLVQLAVSMQDERTQPTLARVPHVDLRPLPALLSSRPGLKVTLLNWFRALPSELLGRLAAAGQVYFDISTLEGVGGIEVLLKQVSARRILFGSHAPLFYPESVLLKLRESRLEPGQTTAIGELNARQLLASRRAS